MLKVIGETTKEILNYNTMQVGRQVENTFKTEAPQNSHHFTRLDASRKWKALSCRSFTWDVNKKIQKARLKTGSLGFPSSSACRESACNAGDPSSIPGSGRSTVEGIGYPLQYSGLENSMDYPWSCKESDMTE